MKVICAWCLKIIGHKCPTCGDKLFPHPDDPNLLICRNGNTPLIYSLDGIAAKTISHGICEECAERIRNNRADKPTRTLTEEEKANLIAQLTPTPKDKP